MNLSLVVWFSSLSCHVPNDCAHQRGVRFYATATLRAYAGLYSLLSVGEFAAWPTRIPCKKSASRGPVSADFRRKSSGLRQVWRRSAGRRHAKIPCKRIRRRSSTGAKFTAGTLPRPAPVTPTFGKTRGVAIWETDRAGGKGAEFSLLGNSPPLLRRADDREKPRARRVHGRALVC